MNESRRKRIRKLRRKQINYVLRMLEEAFDKCNTLEEWENESYSIYMTHCTFSYDIFKRLKEYAGV